MISFISGKILDKSDKKLTVMSGEGVTGLGFGVFTTDSTILSVKDLDSISLWTYMAVRENSIDLYGFRTKDELSLFELLITVSGIGPKSALGILNIATIESLYDAIQNNDVGYLTKVSGIGKKTAEKIVLELRDKISSVKISGEDRNIPSGRREESDAILALESLGYGERESREALKQVSTDGAKTSDIIKEALRFLQK